TEGLLLPLPIAPVQPEPRERPERPALPARSAAAAAAPRWLAATPRRQAPAKAPATTARVPATPNSRNRLRTSKAPQLGGFLFAELVPDAAVTPPRRPRASRGGADSGRSTVWSASPARHFATSGGARSENRPGRDPGPD